MTFPLRAEIIARPDITGSYTFTSLDGLNGPETGLSFYCPCGCGNVSWLAFSGREHGGGPEWDWNGDRDRPTLSPSVLQSGMPCKWHGFLVRGYWVLNPADAPETV